MIHNAKYQYIRTQKIGDLVMIFKTLMIFLLATSTVIAKENFFLTHAENLPDVGIEKTIYLGDKMMQQRYGYNAQCLTPKQDLVFARKKTGYGPHVDFPQYDSICATDSSVRK